MTNLRRYDLNLLTVFEAIYHERSITRAAERIAISQPAVSAALNRLRDAMQDDLFVLQGRTMQPTPKARAIAVDVFRSLDLIRKSLADADAFDPFAPHTFKLAGTEHLESCIAADLIKNTSEIYPDMKVLVYSGFFSSFRGALKSGEIDIVVDYMPISDDEFQMELIVGGPPVALVRKDHPLAGRTLDLRTTLGMKYVVLVPADPQGFPMERFLRSHDAADRIAAQVEHFHTMLSVIESSDLVCEVPGPIARRLGPRYDVTPVCLAMPTQLYPTVLIWHRSQTSDPANQWIRALVSQLLRDNEQIDAAPPADDG